MLTTIANFDGTDGDVPAPDAITIDAAGDLYGTAQTGGSNGDGTAWAMLAGSTEIVMRASFDATTGSDPASARSSARPTARSTA